MTQIDTKVSDSTLPAVCLLAVSLLLAPAAQAQTVPDSSPDASVIRAVRVADAPTIDMIDPLAGFLGAVAACHFFFG